MIMTGKCICSKVWRLTLNPFKGVINSVNPDPRGHGYDSGKTYEWVWRVSEYAPRCEFSTHSKGQWTLWISTPRGNEYDRWVGLTQGVNPERPVWPLIYKWAEIEVLYCDYMTRLHTPTTTTTTYYYRSMEYFLNVRLFTFFFSGNNTFMNMKFFVVL